MLFTRLGKKAIFPFLLIGLLVVAGGYYYLSAPDVDFQCTNIYTSEYSATVYFEVYASGEKTLILSDAEMDIYIKPKDHESIPFAHKEFLEFIEIPPNKVTEYHTYPETNWEEWYEYYDAQQFADYSERYIEFRETAEVIVIVKGQISGRSIKLKNTLPFTVLNWV